MTEPSTKDADQAVLSLCHEFWQWREKESPEMSTLNGHHQFDTFWDDVSKENYLKREEKAKDFLSRAEKIDPNKCTDDVALSYKLFVDAIKVYLKGVPFKTYYTPLNLLEGIHVDANIVIDSMKSDTEDDLNVFMTRLKAFPSRIDQVTDVMKLGVKEGIVNYSCSMQVVPSQLDIVLNTDPEKHGLLKPLHGDHPNIPPEVISKLRTEAKDILTKSILPALKQLKEYVEKEYIPTVRPHLSIGTLKDSDGWYQQCLDFHTSCSMTPQEIHDLGLKEVARIEKNILELAKKEGLPDNLPDLLQAIIKKQENTFKNADEVLAFVRDLCYNRIRPKITQYFKNLPSGNMQIEPTPPYLADSPAGYYRNGSADGSKDGTYFINTNNLKGCMPFSLPALSLHEGEPGHHLQSVYQMAASHLPAFRRYIEDGKYYMAPHSFPFNSAYVEGWGLYCEALGEEMGVYNTNLELLGKYNMEILRAARLVVDTGMHAFGWSRDKAVQFVVNHTMEDRKTIEVEIDRYITWPGQACGYKVGELKIWELRRKAEKELGANFDIKEFHHCILLCGSVPMSVLEEIVDKFILDNKSVK